jgi:hypothetical protein
MEGYTWEDYHVASDDRMRRWLTAETHNLKWDLP